MVRKEIRVLLVQGRKAIKVGRDGRVLAIPAPKEIRDLLEIRVRKGG